MTVIAEDEWHIVEVSSAILYREEWEGVPYSLEGLIHYEWTTHHTDKCPTEVYPYWCNFHEDKVWECEENPADCINEYRTRYLCCVGSDDEFQGEDFIQDLGLDSGLWRVRGCLSRDYYGEYDVTYSIERLHGPIDEREFEMDEAFEGAL